MTASRIGWVEADEVLGGEQELDAEAQAREPVVDPADLGQRAEAAEIHEAHFHAVARDVVEFAGEFLEGNE
ncbi:hypothetical protein LTR94_038445, partial [Friedmanniomyces endolithicus]